MRVVVHPRRQIDRRPAGALARRGRLVLEDVHRRGLVDEHPPQEVVSRSSGVRANRNARKHIRDLGLPATKTHTRAEELQLVLKKKRALIDPKPVHLRTLVLEDVGQILRKAELKKAPVVERELAVRFLPHGHLPRESHLLNGDQVIVLKLGIRPTEQIRLQPRVFEAAQDSVHPQRMRLTAAGRAPVEDLPGLQGVEHPLFRRGRVIQGPCRHRLPLCTRCAQGRDWAPHPQS